MQSLVGMCLLVSLIVSLCVLAHAGLRGPGKYSGVVLFDRWGGCILFSGVYLMYVSEAVKGQLRAYDGQAIEIDALSVVQPTDPGDGLIRTLRVLGPARPSTRPFTFEGIKLEAQPKAIADSRMGVELTITNENEELGFALLSPRVVGATTPSDGPSTAVITRTNLFYGKGTWALGTGHESQGYSYFVTDDTRLPQTLSLQPHESRNVLLAFRLPAGHYQFFAGYGGGVHEAKLTVSNPVSIDLW
jgi:hypothetical protein